MKYNIKPAQKDFEPITIEITLESLEELKSMWVRMHKSNNWDDNKARAKGAYMDTFAFWDKLDNLLEERTK